MTAAQGYHYTAAALELFGNKAYPTYTFQGVNYVLTEGEQTYRCTIDYVTNPNAKPRLISIFEGFADSMRFLIGSIVFFESLENPKVSKQNLLFEAMVYMADLANSSTTVLPDDLPEDLKKTIREIKTQHCKLHNYLNPSSYSDSFAEAAAKQLHTLSVDLKKQLAAYVGEETKHLQKKVGEKQQIAQIYGGIHCAFSTFIAPDQETVEYCLNPYDKAANNAGLRREMRITTRSSQPKLSEDFISRVIEPKAIQDLQKGGDSNITQQLNPGNRQSTMTDLGGHSDHFYGYIVSAASPVLERARLFSDVSDDSLSESENSTKQTDRIEGTQQKTFTDNFNAAHKDRIKEVAAPSAPYDAAMGNVRNLTHNELHVEISQDNRKNWSTISRDSFNTMGTVDLFQLFVPGVTATMEKRLRKAKRMIREALKAQLKERLDNFKQLYAPLIQYSNTPVKFYLDYLTLLSPCLIDSLHAIVDSNQEFVDIAQQAMKNLEEEFYATAKDNPAAAAQELGLQAVDLHKIELVFTHSNTPANDLVDEAGSTQGGNKRFAQQLMTQRNIVDDPFNQQTRDKKKAWVEILDNDLQQGNQAFFDANFVVEVENKRSSSQVQRISLKQLFDNVIKLIKGEVSSPGEIIAAITSMKTLEQLLNNPDDRMLNTNYLGDTNNLALCQEIAFRLKATVELCLSEQRIYRHAPEYFAKDYNYYHARSALESCCMGQAAVKLNGCKSGRDRTAFVSAAIRAYHICGESTGKIFQQTVSKEINSGHDSRRLLSGQSKRVKIEDVDAGNAYKTDENNQVVHPGIVDAIYAKKNVRGTKGRKASAGGVGAKIWSGVKAVATGLAGAVVGVVALPLLTDFLKPSLSRMLGHEGKAFRVGFAVSRFTCYLPVIALVALYSYIDKKLFWPDRKRYIEQKNMDKQNNIPEGDRVPYRARPHALLTPLVNNLCFFREEQPEYKSAEEHEAKKAAFLAGAAMNEGELNDSDSAYPEYVAVRLSQRRSRKQSFSSSDIQTQLAAYEEEEKSESLATTRHAQHGDSNPPRSAPSTPSQFFGRNSREALDSGLRTKLIPHA